MWRDARVPTPYRDIFPFHVRLNAIRDCCNDFPFIWSQNQLTSVPKRNKYYYEKHIKFDSTRNLNIFTLYKSGVVTSRLGMPEIDRFGISRLLINPFMPTVPTFAVRETASLGIMGAPRVPPLNPSESIVL